MTWLLLGGITAFGVAQMLRALAIRVRNEVAVHDLKCRVAELQAKRLKQVMLRHGLVPLEDAEPELGEVEFVDDEPAPSPERAAA
ncbi:MAG: hypothetical protein H6810_00030 [Phycisphaeraceae bacterium]|nr:MAG: hypothetical protein H6810_00030 [Phycisphaeraceae bacterium]